MPVQLKPGAKPVQFADAVEKSFALVAHKIAGSDDVIAPDEAQAALTQLSGPDTLLHAALAGIAAGTQSVSVADFVHAQRDRALVEASKVTGADGKLSKADAERLPADLRLAFHFLRTGKMPDAFADGLAKLVPEGWRKALAPVATKINVVDKFVEEDRRTHAVWPARELTFNALKHTALDDVKVVIIGQDPYPTAGNAMGLSFSVPPSVQPLPASLKNIFAELDSDLGIPSAKTGDLTKWAERGVLLLNTVLTVREGAPASHRGKGWEEITDQILQQVNAKDEKVVFLLLGADAQKLGAKIDTSKHTIVSRSHPSPLSVKKNFTGTKPFSEINAALVAAGQTPIDWRL